MLKRAWKKLKYIPLDYAAYSTTSYQITLRFPSPQQSTALYHNNSCTQENHIVRTAAMSSQRNLDSSTKLCWNVMNHDSCNDLLNTDVTVGLGDTKVVAERVLAPRADRRHQKGRRQLAFLVMLPYFLIPPKKLMEYYISFTSSKS